VKRETTAHATAWSLRVEQASLGRTVVSGCSTWVTKCCAWTISSPAPGTILHICLATRGSSLMRHDVTFPLYIEATESII